ncbi:MAG: helix-turn-helix domain-containing protein [Chloroflexota bacterium]
MSKGRVALPGGSPWAGGRLRVGRREKREPKTYEVDPEAVERMKRILAEKEGRVEATPNDTEVDSMSRKRTNFKKNVTPERAANWARLRREGKSYRQITEMDSLSPSLPTIKKYLREFGYGYDGLPLNGDVVDETPAAEPSTPEPEPQPEPDPLEGLVDVAEAAEILDVDEETVRRYLRDGQLEGEKVHGKWVMEHDDLDAFIEREWRALVKQDEERVATPVAQDEDEARLPVEVQVERQLGALQELLTTVEAQGVKVSGRITADLSIEIEF